MARTELAPFLNQRISVCALFVRFGSRRAYKGPPIVTVLLGNVRTGSGRFLCDHVWMDCGKRFDDLQLSEGDQVQFVARVSTYWKGYRGRREDIDWCNPPETDYRFSYPTQVKKLNVPTTQLRLFDAPESPARQLQPDLPAIVPPPDE